MELKGQILKIADVVERNGRMYPQAELEKAVTKFQEKVKNQQGVLGILGEPEHAGKINLYEISHAVTNVRMEDDKMVADLKVLDTPNGKILKQMLEAGASPQFSVSGYGSVRDDGTVVDFEIVTVYSKTSLV